MSLESGKTMAGIGAILLVIPVPFLSIAGIILVLIGMKYLSQAYNDESIWNNTLYAVIFGIIGIVASGLTLVSLFFGGLFAWATLGLGGATGLAGFFAGIALFLVVAFIFYILEAIYIRKAFDSLATRSGVGLFRTGGLAATHRRPSDNSFRWFDLNLRRLDTNPCSFLLDTGKPDGSTDSNVAATASDLKTLFPFFWE